MRWSGARKISVRTTQCTGGHKVNAPGEEQPVIGFDLGDATDVHPRNKQEVGRRLALAARKIAYGEELVHSGPIYRAHHVKNGRVAIEFDHCGAGLAVKGPKLNWQARGVHHNFACY